MRRIVLMAVVLFVAITWAFYPKSGSEADVQEPAVSVAVVDLEEGSLGEKVQLLGTVFSLDSVDIKAEVEGRIQEVAVSSSQHVEQGQLLIQLDDRHQRAIVLREQARLADILRQHKNVLQLLPKGAVTQAEVDRYESEVAMQQAELALATAALEDKAIVAPFSGQLGLVDLSAGKLVNTDTVLMTLDNTDSLRLNVPIAARYLGRVEVGQELELWQAGLVERRFKAEVSSIDSRVRNESLNVYIQLSIDNRELGLAPGILVTGSLRLLTQPSLLLPLDAIAYDGQQRFAYRVQDNVAQKVEIELGERSAAMVEVKSGLALGDKVVYRGIVKLHDGIEVDVIEG